MAETSLDEILENIDLKTPEQSDWRNKKPIAFHLDPPFKMKYEELQAASKGKFGKSLQEIVKYAINKSHSKLDEAS